MCSLYMLCYIVDEDETHAARGKEDHKSRDQIIFKLQYMQWTMLEQTVFICSFGENYVLVGLVFSMQLNPFVS